MGKTKRQLNRLPPPRHHEDLNDVKGRAQDQDQDHIQNQILLLPQKQLRQVRR